MGAAESPPEFVVIAASNWQQACLAAEQLGFSPRDHAGLSRGRWFYASSYHKVMSLLPQRVVFARPLLGDPSNQLLVEEWLTYRCMRTRVTPEYVTT